MAFVGGGGWRRCGSEKKHGLALLMTLKKKVVCAGALKCAGMLMCRS